MDRKMWYIYHMECYWVIKKKKGITRFAGKLMELKKMLYLAR